MESPGSKVFIIGGRRGLGQKIAEEWSRRCIGDVVQTTSRTTGATFQADLSKDEDVNSLCAVLDREKPTRIFYVPGGGPYGAFAKKEWKDHSWALSVSLLAPMRILHHATKTSYGQQIIFIGSAVAEGSPDINASSYCAAKHGLKGLVSTVRIEEENKDIRLFSPSYMATDMLPANAAEKTGKVVLDPTVVAKEFVNWALEPQAAWHKIYTP